MIATVDHMANREAYQAYYDAIGDVPALLVAHYNPDRMRHFHPRQGQSILELGCGTGGNLVVYSRMCPMVGVEVSRPMVRTAQSVLRMKRPPNPAEVHQGFIEDFHDLRRFDHVILTEVLEHVFDPVTVLRVAREHLSQDGEVYITAPAIRVGSISHVRGVSYDELELWLEQAALRPIWHITEPNKKLMSDVYSRTVCKAVAA